MKRIAQFEKVSFAEYRRAMLEYDDALNEDAVRKIYKGIKIPHRATGGSAGYDFFAPFDFEVSPGKEIRIPSGIRVKIDNGYVLMLFPRSSLGFRYRFQLDNTVGIIDSDYYHADNEGHIFCKMINDSREEKTVRIRAGAGFAQGIFVPFGITADDDASEIRTGGIGSTDRKEERNG